MRPALLLLAAVIALGADASAQPPAASTPMTAPPVVTAADHVVVTGVAESAPLTVTADPKLPRQPIPAHDGAEYLDTVPGFSTVRKGGSGADPVFRGMAGSRVSILVDDGALLGGCSSRMDAPTAYVFPETFDRITIVKGPQTVTLGPPASAGTVRFERTRQHAVGPFWTGNASLLGGSWGRNDQVADVRAGTAAFYVRAAGSRSAMDDYDDGAGQSVHGRYLRWSADGAIGWTPSQATLVEVGVSGSDGEAAYADRSVDGAKFARLGVSWRAEHTRSGAALDRLSLTGFYSAVDHVMDNYTLRTFVPTPASPMRAAMNPSRITAGGRLATRGMASRATWEAGADLLANAHANRTSMRVDTQPVESLPRVGDARFSSVGLFGELSWQQRPSRLVVMGARADLAHTADLRQWVALGMMAQVANPTASARRDDVLPSAFGRVEQQVGPRPLTVYAGVGHVRRMADYWELIARESTTSVSAFGTRPEATTQFDAGLQWRGRTGSAWLAVFANVVNDFILIESGVIKPAMMGTRTAVVTRNVDARTAGAEAGVTRRVGRLTTDASIAYARGTNTTDDRPLAQMAPLDGKLSLAWGGDRWSAGGLLRAVARQDRVAVNQGTIVGQDLGATAGFAVLSLNGSVRLARIGTVSMGVDNVLDHAYVEHLSRAGAAIPGYTLQTARGPEPGRTWWLRVNVRR